MRAALPHRAYTFWPLPDTSQQRTQCASQTVMMERFLIAILFVFTAQINSQIILKREQT